MYLLTSALLTDQGRKRPHNEDFVEFFEPDDLDELRLSGNLYIVADGVGGASKGERASQYAAQKVLYEYYRYPEMDLGERLRQAFRLAGNEIYHYAEESERFMQMATTMVAAVIRGDTLTIANVGDSRAYLIRDGLIQQITRDHSFVGEMVRDNQMSEAEARRSRNKNRITRSLGGELNVKVDVFSDIALQPGDKILLCSDGLTRYTTSQNLQELTDLGEPEEIVQRLVDFANRSGGVDNISALLVEVGQPVTETELAMLTPRGQAPTPVDWEKMDTVLVEDDSSRSLQVQLLRQFLPYVAYAVVIILGLVAIGAGAFLINKFFVNNEPSDTEVYMTEMLLPPTGTLAPTTKTTPSKEFSQTPTQTATTMFSTSPATSPTITTSNSPIPIEIEQILCRYKVEDGDTLLGIFSKLNKEFSIEEVTCPLILNNEDCNLNDTEIIRPGWILEFKKVDQNICDAHGTPVINNTNE